MAGSMVGKTLNNRYKITERVGLGGMAEVYKAQDTVLGRIVAVKIMLPQYAADPTFTQRFRQEAASAAKLQSPYIVSIYDWGLDDDTYYIVMEFLRGTDLKTAIQERGAVNQRKVAEIGSQVAQALSVAHDGGIIHRDIKPQNIMIQPDGNIKVMDFGIARAGDAGLSQTSTVLGTAHYVSPEQAQGKDLTGASDIYSLGIVLYEAATGKLPFEGNDAVSVALKQVNEQPVPPRQINPDIDPVLEGIIMCALSKNPAERFADASAMRKALNDYLAGRPVTLPSGGQATRIMQPGSAAATTVMSTPAADGTRVMPNMNNGAARDPRTRQMRNPHQPPESDTDPQKSKTTLIIAAVLAIALVIIGLLAFSCSQGGEKVPVPDLAGKTQVEAEATLAQAGLVLGEVSPVFNPDIPEGQVVGSDPSAFTQVEKGSKVNLTVSKGTEMAIIPDLTNLNKNEALTELQSRGLEGVEGKSVFSDEVEEGKIASQDEKGGQEIAVGSTITFHMSKGPDKKEIPNVVGMSESAAKKELEDAGFRWDVRESTSDSVDTGYVISQSETGKAKEGATIAITVSTGSATKEIPDVVGEKKSEAERDIANAGFRYDTVYAPSDDVDKDFVIKQSKTGSAKAGTTIRITVSSGPSTPSGGGGANNNGATGQN